MLLLGISATVRAEATKSADQAKLIEQLLARIDRLEKRVAVLEGNPTDSADAGLVGSPAAEEPKIEPARETRPAIHQEHVQQPHGQALSGETQPQYPLFHLAGFSDFNFSATDRSGSRSGFNEGQFVLHMVSALSPKVNFFGEISFTARADAGIGTPRPAGFDPEIERSIIRLDHSDKLKVSFRRYHTPIN